MDLMTAKEKLKRYEQILNQIEDQQDKYAWLMDFGKNSMSQVDELKLDKFLVTGCQTRTWLIPGYVHQNNTMHFSADSDALISKGMVCLIADVFSGSTEKEIKDFDLQKFDTLHLDILLTPGRRNGVHNMLQTIKSYGK
jgi:cysteine desulfuration protein SufE|tara:strand:+ start:520 stop:936 length:417 start_codon:yes stop_codon:yes gene_type:complete